MTAPRSDTPAALWRCSPRRRLGLSPSGRAPRPRGLRFNPAGAALVGLPRNPRPTLLWRGAGRRSGHGAADTGADHERGFAAGRVRDAGRSAGVLVRAGGPQARCRRLGATGRSGAPRSLAGTHAGAPQHPVRRQSQDYLGQPLSGEFLPIRAGTALTKLTDGAFVGFVSGLPSNLPKFLVEAIWSAPN